MSGILYIVPTPIGNLEDMTLRAIRILKESDLVLCEDTLVTHKLFQEYEIDSKTSIFYANSSLKDLERALDTLASGKVVSLVSDAGTPTISDPGFLLVEKVYQTLPECQVIALPGASALTTALSVSGISSAQFTFYGFLPHKKGRETIFKHIRDSKMTSVFYESVHRIEKTLNSLVEYVEPERKVAIARELTKIHEEIVRGTAEEVKTYFLKKKDHVRGEFVVIVSGK